MKNTLTKPFGYCLCCLLFILSCGDSEQGKPPVIPLSGTTLKNNAENYGMRFIALVDSTFYMLSIRRDTLINAYKIKEDSLISKRSFLLYGNGPYEGRVFAGLYDTTFNTLSLFENSGVLKYGFVIKLDSEDAVYNTSLWQKMNFDKIENTRFGHGFVYLSDTLLLAIGGIWDTKNILTIINLETQETIPLQFWINDGFEKNIKVKQAVYMNNAKIFKNTIFNKYLYVCGEGRYMEIFTIDNYHVTDRKVVCNIFPKYSIAEDGMNYRMSRETSYRGLDVVVTDNLIYAKREEFTYELHSYKGYPI